MERVAFLGLGAMGAPMAANLLKAGVEVVVWNRSADRVKPLVEAGATAARSPREAAERVGRGGVVWTMLFDDAAVRAVADAVGDALGEGGVHISSSTIGPETGEALAAELATRGASYVAAPVLGKPDVAAAGKLIVMVSGPAGARERVKPLLEKIGSRTVDFGEGIQAHVVKLAGNFMLGAAIEAMAEAFTLGQKFGVDRKAMWEMFSETLFACPVYKAYGKLVAEEKYVPVGAPPALIRKDFGLILDAARRGQAPMPVASLVHDRLTAIVARGEDAGVDWASFANEVSRAAGV
jgi:3-hydroxyisobutyrate dehydrogenase-like beta-hydroxyacid dehydrogenase